MEAYQERVVTERDQLADKLNALVGFLFSPTFEKLRIAEQNRLRHQHRVMTLYRDILNERIHAFGDPDAA